MRGDINFDSTYKILNLPYPTLSSEPATKQFVEMIGLFSILQNATSAYVDIYGKQHAECFYGVERELKTEILLETGTRKVDWTLSHLDATQGAQLFRRQRMERDSSWNLTV